MTAHRQVQTQLQRQVHADRGVELAHEVGGHPPGSTPDVLGRHAVQLQAKVEIRRRFQVRYGYRASSIYCDMFGLADYLSCARGCSPTPPDAEQLRRLPHAAAFHLARRLEHRQHRAAEGVALQRIPRHRLVQSVQLA